MTKTKKTRRTRQVAVQVFDHVTKNEPKRSRQDVDKPFYPKQRVWRGVQ